MNSINSIKLFSILTTLAGLVFYGASAFTQGYEIPDPDAGAGAKGLPTNFITPQELKKLIDEGSDKIIIVDNAPAEAFEEEHIPGAVNLPWVQAIRPPIKLPHNKNLGIEITEALEFFAHIDGIRIAGAAGTIQDQGLVMWKLDRRSDGLDPG